jgi:hypothetical protein
MVGIAGAKREKEALGVFRKTAKTFRRKKPEKD